ncbi:MAG: hypothetical protein JRN35_06060 [Nitrososphaerota archaeon]|nr:hypothetical protein [Nitrososphaerota archaeon]
MTTRRFALSRDEQTVQWFYWIVSRRLRDGRLTIVGPKSSQTEAEQFGYEKNLEPFEVVPLHTRDRGAATSQIKARNLDLTGDLEQSIRRSSHQVQGERGNSGDSW